MIPQVILRQVFFQTIESFLRSVHDIEELQVVGRDHARIYQRLEVDDLVPVIGAIQQHDHFLRQLLGLRQGQNFEQLVERTKSAGEDHQRLRQVGKPQLTHEEVVELEVQFRSYIRIRH